MKVERVADVLANEDLSRPPANGVRIDFDSWGLLEQAGIPHDMGATNEDEYFQYIEGLGAEVGDDVHVRSAPSMVGPAAGDGTPTFIDLFTQAKDWVALAVAVGTAVRWLRRAGVGQMRVSERGIEALARWELRNRGMSDHMRLIDIKLIPGPPSPYTGVPPSYLGYLATFARDDSGVIVVRLSLDGLFEGVINEDARSDDP